MSSLASSAHASVDQRRVILAQLEILSRPRHRLVRFRLDIHEKHREVAVVAGITRLHGGEVAVARARVPLLRLRRPPRPLVRPGHRLEEVGMRRERDGAVVERERFLVAALVRSQLREVLDCHIAVGRQLQAAWYSGSAAVQSPRSNSVAPIIT